MTIYYKSLSAFIVFFFCMLGISTAQEFIVISCNGHVHHMMAEDTIPYKIRAGDKISASGKLKLDENASIKLICNERPQTFSDVEEVDLEEVYSEISTQSISFTGRFWNFIVDGLKSSDSDKDLKEYHSEYLNIKGGIKGYSGTNEIIKIMQPFGGVITGSKMPVAWNSKNMEGIFTVSILDKSDRNIVYENKTKSRDLSISLKELGLERNDRQYYLRISDDDCNYSEVEFQYSVLDSNTIDKKLNSIIEYQNAEDKEKAWMRATVLEMQGYLVDADELFRQLITDYPSDNYIQKLYLLFKIRTNQIDTI